MATSKSIGINWLNNAARPTKQYSSDALVAGAQVATQSTILCGFHASNTHNATLYVQVHDSATAPADTAVPLASFKVAAGDHLVVRDLPIPLTHGCYICVSSTQGTKTLASALMLLLAYVRA